MCSSISLRETTCPLRSSKYSSSANNWGVSPTSHPPRRTVFALWSNSKSAAASFGDRFAYFRRPNASTRAISSSMANDFTR